MNERVFKRDEIELLLKNSLNKTLGDVDIKNVFDRTKKHKKITGIAGDVIEQSLLGLKPNNSQRPDIVVDDVEIEVKTTGIRISKKNSKIYEAKEPISITAVSIDQIVEEKFCTSNFWHKLENMLLVYYDYNSITTVPASEYARFYIKGYEFHEFSNEDKSRLKADWETVKEFLKNLKETEKDPEKKYPRLSSDLRSKLQYIDTAPKWPNSPRFRLKRQFVTGIVQNYFGNKLDKLPELYTGFGDIDDKCVDLTRLYSGKTIAELAQLLGINKVTSKSISEQIIVRMFGGRGTKMSKIELFAKLGIKAKTVTITKEGLHTEDMKLFPIDFNEWTDTGTIFEDSMIYDYFSNNQFIYSIFREPSKKSSLSENIFVGFKRIAFSDDKLNKCARKLWKDVRRLVNENKLEVSTVYDRYGDPITNKNGVVRNSVNFPKSKNNLIFIRGSGIDSSKKTIKVNGIDMYRQYVWIKGSYIANSIKEVSKVNKLGL